jgi:hypothetical protein
MDNKTNLLSWIILVIILFTGCEKNSLDKSILLEGAIKTDLSSKSAFDGSIEHIIVLAINPKSDIFAGETDAEGVFEITIPGQDKYSIFFFSSANQFIGALEINKVVMALKAGDVTMDLGDITLQNGMAVSSIEQDLSKITTTTDFNSPEDIVYNKNTSRICSFLYNPMNEGDITVYQGCGNCDPGEIDNYLRMSICSYEYVAELNRIVCAIQHYNIITGIIENLAAGQLGDKIYWYVSATGMVQYKIQRASGTIDIGAGEVPDFLEVGKTYSGNNYSIVILNTFNQTAFPTLGSLLLDGFVMEVHEGNDLRYNWIAKDIGEVLNTSTNSNIDYGNNVRMKVIFRKTGTKTFGTRPVWLTDEFLHNLIYGPDEPPESENLIKLFDRESYLPIYNDAYWEYSNGMGAYIYNIDTVNNNFKIYNKWGAVETKATIEKNDTGYYIGVSSTASSEFLPLYQTSGLNPLVYINSAVVAGLNWQAETTSNGYTVKVKISYESTDTNITTGDGKVYDDCLVIKCSYEYPSDYQNTVRYPAEVIHYVKKGVGFVQKIVKYSDNTSKTTYLTNYSIPQGK